MHEPGQPSPKGALPENNMVPKQRIQPLKNTITLLDSPHEAKIITSSLQSLFIPPCLLQQHNDYCLEIVMPNTACTHYQQTLLQNASCDTRRRDNSRRRAQEMHLANYTPWVQYPQLLFLSPRTPRMLGRAHNLSVMQAPSAQIRVRGPLLPNSMGTGDSTQRKHPPATCMEQCHFQVPIRMMQMLTLP